MSTPARDPQLATSRGHEHADGALVIRRRRARRRKRRRDPRRWAGTPRPLGLNPWCSNPEPSSARVRDGYTSLRMWSSLTRASGKGKYLHISPFVRRAVTGVDMPGPPPPAPSSQHRSVSPARPRQRDPLASLRSVLRRHTFDTLSLSNDVQGPALASADDQSSSATNRGFPAKRPVLPGALHGRTNAYHGNALPTELRGRKTCNAHRTRGQSEGTRVAHTGLIQVAVRFRPPREPCQPARSDPNSGSMRSPV